MQDQANVISANFIITCTATFFALCAVVVAVWHGFLMRRHQKLSVIPRLRFERFALSDQDLLIKLSSVGLGPALITTFDLYIDGKLIPKHANSSGNDPQHHWQDVLNKLYLPSEIHCNWFYIVPEEVMAPGEKKDVIKFVGSSLNETIRKQTESELKRLNIRIKYTSLYGGKKFVCSLW